MTARTTGAKGRSTSVVAMLFSDIEGSTRIAHRLGNEWPVVLDLHRSIARATFEETGGRIVGTEGDSLFAVFDDPLASIRAASAFQAALADAEWPVGGHVRVRVGLHVGSVSHVGEDYVGTEVHRAARIGAGAHGGQVLVSETAKELVGDRLPTGLELRDLGRYRLKDFDGPQDVYQLVGPRLEAEFPPVRLTELDPTNLPGRSTSFIGRDDELARVIELIESARLVTLVGTGGIGKTRLMLEAGGRLLDRYPDGVWLVELASLGDPALVPDAVARAIRTQDVPGRGVMDTVTDFLRAKGIVLLIDNCEHLVDAVADLVARLLAACPDLVVLASSREALNVAGEVVFNVPSMDVRRDEMDADHEQPSGDRAAATLESPAVRLFIERAQAARPSFIVSDADARAIGEICRRLDGIPLAIELAASRVTTMSPQEIAAGLDHRLRLLTGGRRTAVPRQQTLRALFDWSWDLLDEQDRRLLAGLSVFAGGWTLDAAAAVTGPVDRPAPDTVPGRRSDVTELDTLDGLARLVDRSLVMAEPGSPTRYRLLETVREYAADQAEAADLTVGLLVRHLAHYLDLAESIEPGLLGPDMVSLLRRLDPEIDNLRVALDSAASEADSGRALRLSLAMAAYWRSRAVGSEHLVRLAWAAETVMAGSPSDAGRDEAVLWARVLAAAARAHGVYGDIQAARRWSDRAIELVRETHDLVAMTDAVAARGIVAVFAGETAGLTELVEEIARRAAETEDWWVIALNSAGSALADLAAGHPDAAEAKLAVAADSAARTGNPFVIAFVALSRGRVAGFEGRLDEARRWFDEAIAAYELMGDRRFVLVSQSDLAHALRQGGAIDEAEELYRRTLREWLYLGNRGAVANQLESFAFIALARHHPMRAAHLLGAAEAIREDVHAAMLPVERFEYAAAIERLRDVLAPEEFEREMGVGRALTYDAAVAMVMLTEAEAT